MKTKIVNKIPSYKVQATASLDTSLGGLARDIQRDAKMQVPVKGGHLQDSIRAFKITNLHHRVEVKKEYAKFQEFGGDAKRRVRHYTTPGTKSRYLRDPFELIVKEAIPRIEKLISAIRV